MEPKKWFLIRFTKGKAEIVSMFYDSFEDALANCHTGLTICETVYG